jgi:putrescine transport system substrate-binding protein
MLHRHPAVAGTSRLLRLAAVAVVALAATVPSRAADPKVLNIYNWSDYIADDTIKNFEKETGIKVNYDNYDSRVLLAKLIAGNTGYDIVVPGAHFAKSQIEGGLLQKLDRQAHELGQPRPDAAQAAGCGRPGQPVPGRLAVGLRHGRHQRAKVKAALGDLPMPDNAWSLIFDPKYAAKLKAAASASRLRVESCRWRCSTSQAAVQHERRRLRHRRQDAAVDALRDALFVVGLHQRPRRRVAVRGDGYSGDINIARARSKPTEAAGAIEALVPKGRATLFFDSMAIPKDAKNVANAHLFINYILRPEVAAALTNKVFYANPNAASLKFVKKDVAENKTIFLPAADQARMTPPDAVPQAIRRVQTRIFTNFKAGR